MDIPKKKVIKFFNECRDAHASYIQGLIGLSEFMAFIGQYKYFCRGIVALSDSNYALCIGHEDDDIFEPNTDFYIPAVMMVHFETKAPAKCMQH
jgi:hypothetical protein